MHTGSGSGWGLLMGNQPYSWSLPLPVPHRGEIMTPERWEKIKWLFQLAMELPTTERNDFLRRQCDGVEELRCEVATMLDDAAAAESFMKTSALHHLAAEMAREQPSLIGQTISHYYIEAELGAGGMGRVFKARDERLKRHVAIKILPAEFTADAVRVRRFEQEAYAASALNHPCIITIYEIGQAEWNGEGLHYIAYELIEGQTLRERLRQSRLSWPEVVAIAAQIAEALRAAHAAGIIHRDVKPENVMLRADGRVKVLDFGIAKRFDVPVTNEDGSAPDHAPSFDNSTLTGGLMGTLGYLSPEQARMERVDARTDLFALGLMMHEMLAGRHPLAEQSNDQKLAALVSDEELPAISSLRTDIPAALAALVKQAIRKQREERYSSAGAMLETLNQLKPAVENKADKHRSGMQTVFRQQNANQLLNQLVSLAAVERGTRLSPAALWTIWRHSTIKRGRLESALLRRSLLSTLGKAGLIALAAGLVVLALAAGFSVDERWDEQIMHDGHTRRVTQLALSPDGRTLVSVSFDRKVIVWDLERRVRRATLTEHTGNVTAVAFSPDGKLFATTGADGDGRLIVWDAARLTKVVALPGWRSWSYEIAFTPDGRFLVAPSESENPRSLNVWEVGTWRKVATVPGERPIVISPDGRWLIGQDSRTFELASGKELGARFELPGKSAFSPDSSRLAAVEPTGQVSFWDVSRFWSAAERKLIDRYPAHRDHGHAIAYSPDGRMVASASDTIIVWDARTHEKLARFAPKDTVNSLVFTHDSRQIISGQGDGTVVIWDIAEKEPLANLAEHCAPVLSARFSPDGQSVISASEDHSIIIWDAASGLKRAVLIGHRTPVRTAVFSTDGQWVFSGDLDHNLILWDAATGARLRSFAPERAQKNEFSYRAALSPDKRWIASSFGVYAVDDGHTVVDFFPKAEKEMPAIHDVAFSPDGRWLACVGTFGYIALWEVAQWQPRQMLKISGNYNAATFSADSRQLAIGNNEGEIALWQIEPFEKIGVMKHHVSGIESLAFVPDGRTLASAADDESVAVWDVKRRRFITNVGRHILPVLTVGFAPDGRRLITGEHDHSVRVYTRHRALWGWQMD